MIKPLFNNVLIRPVEAEQKTSYGMYLPDSVKEKPEIGIVVAIGKTEVVKKKDRVLYRKWTGNVVKIKDEELIILEDKDILAIMD